MKINWLGQISQGQGYSGSAENICVALERLGYDVTVASFSKTIFSNLTTEGRLIRQKPFKKADIGIAYGFPVSFDSLSWHKYKFGFSMFETDKLPTGREWAGSNTVDSCNSLTALLVPSNHSKQLFSDIGVTVPIEVVHLGVDADFYFYLSRTARKKTFTFLMSGILTSRKNPGLVVSAFLSLFKDNPNVRLILKTAEGTLSPMLVEPFKNISVIDKYYTPEDMRELYKVADAFVFPSRGEGFGLPPLEAMSTGLPTILASNSGLLEYANPLFNFPIKSAGISPAKRFPKQWGDVGNWYESDLDDLKAKMLWVYENQEEALRIGAEASRWVKKEWTYKNTAQQIKAVIEKYCVS